jgi:hypothetical protein
MRIKYRDLRAYKYELLETYEVYVGITPMGPEIIIDFIRLSREGVLSLRKGYCWDGPSGPAIDSKNFMRGSVVHDALFQLIRLGLLPSSRKADADRLLKRMLLEDGMSSIRANWVYAALALFGSRRTRPMGHDLPKVLEAP